MKKEQIKQKEKVGIAEVMACFFNKKAKEYINQIKTLSKKHENDLIIFGNSYKNSLSHDATKLRIAYLEFKLSLISGFFRINTP